MLQRSALCLALGLAAPLLGGCESFDSPPRSEIAGLADGILADPTQPVQLVFDEPVDAASLSVKLIRFQQDGEGNLFDEDDDDETELTNIVTYQDPIDGDFGGTSTLSEDRRVLTIQADAPFPIGPDLAIIIEPGLKDDLGNEWKVRQRKVFGYKINCNPEDAAPTELPSGYYFFMVDVDKPLSLQIQLWGDIRVDAATGNFVGQFTNADRDPSIDCSQFGLSCDPATEVCRTLPEPECVEPSRKVSSENEYPDFIANNVKPTGYSFQAFGCLRNQPDGSISFTNAPVDVVVESPAVTVEDVVMNASFNTVDGIYRGSGTFNGSDVVIGTSPSGAGVGTHKDVFVPVAEAPSGIPAPTAQPSDAPF